MADSHLARIRRDGQSDHVGPVDLDSTERAPTADDVERQARQALALVLQTGDIIKAAEERSQAIADQGQEIAVRAVNELKIADERIKFLEARLAQAEARAKESEEWLRRVCEAVEMNLADVSLEILAPHPAANFPASLPSRRAA